MVAPASHCVGDIVIGKMVVLVSRLVAQAFNGPKMQKSENHQVFIGWPCSMAYNMYYVKMKYQFCRALNAKSNGIYYFLRKGRG